MSVNQKINSEQLLEQSNQLKALKEEYNAMFANVTSILNEMNEGWSENLSNNFSTKISTAQKGFAKIVEMLECGENVAKESANSFEDVNNVMARILIDRYGEVGLPEGVVPIGITAEELRNIINNYSEPGAYNDLALLEKQLFGTNYLNEAKDILRVTKDVFDGKYNAEILDKLTNMIDLDKASEHFGFGDTTGIEIILEGTKRIFGDGKTLESFDPNIIELGEHFIDDIVPAWKNGDYSEAIVSGVFHSLEASTKMVVDIGVDSVAAIGEKVLDITGLDEAIPWSDLNDTIIEHTGIDFTEAIPEIGREISEEFSRRVDKTIEGITIISDYAADEFGEYINGVANVFSDCVCSIGNWFK